MVAGLSVATKLALGVQVNAFTGGFFDSPWDWTPLAGAFPVVNRLTKNKEGHYPVIFTPTPDIASGLYRRLGTSGETDPAPYAFAPAFRINRGSSVPAIMRGRR